MARWDEEGRWGTEDDWRSGRRDEWRGDDRPGSRVAGGRESSRGDEWRRDDAWRPETWRGSDRGDLDRDRHYRRGSSDYGGARAYGSGRDMPSFPGPYRRGDDYGAREYGSSDMDRDRGWYGAAWPEREDRARDRDRWREPERGGERAGGRWGGGDYTTYGQSGFDESDRARWMNEDLHREQGWRSHPRHGGGGGFRDRDEGGARGSREDRGPLERLGERFREGMARLTGRGPKGYKRSDERIREDVCERIARSGVNAEEVEVRVEKGEVTLTGTADTRDEKRMLEDLADEVFGVEEVHNHVRLSRMGAGSATAPSATGATAGTTAGGTGQVIQQGQAGQRPSTTQPGARH